MRSRRWMVRTATLTAAALLAGMVSALQLPMPEAVAVAAAPGATYAPAVTALPGAASTDVFYRALGRRVAHRTFTNGTWSEPRNLSGVAVGAPAATYAGKRLYVVHRGPTNNAYYKVRVNGTWSTSWVNIGGTLSSSPAVVGWPDGRLDVFARGSADELRIKRYTPGVGWSSWLSLGGELATAPTASRTGTERLHVCASAAVDRAVWCRVRNGSSWSAWNRLGGTTYSVPAITTEPTTGTIRLFIRNAADHALYMRTCRAGVWSDWIRLGGVLVDGPGAAAKAAGTVDVVIRAGNGNVYAKQLRNGTWTTFVRAWVPTSPPAVPTTLRGRIVTTVPTTNRLVAFTFDGGAGSQGVPSIRATLQKYGVPATFFLTGDFVRMFPIRSNELAVGGFDVGNHTDNHPYFTSISDTTATTEVVDAHTAILRTTGVESKPLFRFPYGAYDPFDITLVNDLGYVTVGWTVDSLGWQGTSGGMTVDKVVDRVLAAARPGMIVLMHVGANPRDGTTLDADALPAIIDGLRARGYTFVTLESLTGW